MNRKPTPSIIQVLKDCETHSTEGISPLPNGLKRVLDNVNKLNELSRFKWLKENGFEEFECRGLVPTSLREWVGFYVKTGRLQPSRQKKWEDYVGKVAGDLASLHCKQLIEEASAGKASAIKTLAGLTIQMVKELNRIALRPAGVAHLQPIARKASAWPVMRGSREVLGDDFAVIQSALGIGLDNPIALKTSKKFDPKLRINVLLIRWLEEIEQIRTNGYPFPCQWVKPAKWQQEARKLSSLTRQTSKDWVQVIRTRVGEIIQTKEGREALLIKSGIGFRGKSKRSALKRSLKAEEIAEKEIKHTRGPVTKALREALDSYLGYHAKS